MNNNGKVRLPFNLTPDDKRRGFIKRERYFEYLKHDLERKGHKVGEFTELPDGIGWIYTIDGYGVHHLPVPEVMALDLSRDRSRRGNGN
jgi:hypothetical protein